MWLGLLFTFRAASALKGWCTVRTLQEMVGMGFLSRSLSTRLIPPYKCTKSSLDILNRDEGFQLVTTSTVTRTARILQLLLDYHHPPKLAERWRSQFIEVGAAGN